MSQRNPYTPPDAAPAGVMRAARKRPISAWILVAFLAVTVLALLLGIGQSTLMLASFHGKVRDPIGLGFALAWRLGVVAALIAVIVVIHRGFPVGRWLGLLAIVVFTAFNLLRPDDAQYPNDAQRGGALIAKYFFVPILQGWWAYAFAFSAKAKSFFSRRPPGTS